MRCLAPTNPSSSLTGLLPLLLPAASSAPPAPEQPAAAAMPPLTVTLQLAGPTPEAVGHREGLTEAAPGWPAAAATAATASNRLRVLARRMLTAVQPQINSNRDSMAMHLLSADYY